MSTRSPSTRGPIPSLPPETGDLLEQVLVRFERAWQTGQRPAVEDYLDEKGIEHRVLLVELVHADLHYRIQAGEPVRVEGYLQRYPELQDDPQVVLELVLAEYRLRKERDPNLPFAEFGQRFPQHHDAMVLALFGKSQDSPAEAASPQTTSDQPATRTFAPAPPPGALPEQFGRYRIVRLLGQGGMGAVYLAQHQHLGKQVALKVLSSQHLFTAEFAERFLRELRMVGQLDHPHVVEASDGGQHDGTIFLVMKFVDGTDLARLVRDQGPLAPAEACDLVRQAALGLQYLHEKGLVHRDLKPSNLMRTPEGTVKILDFGLARLRSGPGDPALTEMGQIMGTPDYMAPEQIEASAAVDIRADLYSLGATLFHLLAGKPPFAHHRETWPKLDAHRLEQPPDIRQFCPKIAPELAALVQRMLAKRPEDRPQTPAEAAAALAPFCRGASFQLAEKQGQVKNLPHGSSSELNRLRGRHPWLPWAAGLAATGCLVAVLGLALSGKPSDRPGAKVKANLSQKPPPPVLPLEVVRWEATHLENIRGVMTKPLGLLGVTTFQPRLNDRLGYILGELSEPAHAYLIAYQTDGQEQLCWPEEENQPPPATSEARYPRKGKEEEYGLDEGTGLHLFILAASRQGLPPYQEWKARHGKAPWGREKLPEELADVVWRDRGLGLDGWTQRHPFHPGAKPDDRAKGAEKLGIGPMVRVKRWWKDKPGIEVVAVLAFTVGPRQ